MKNEFDELTKSLAKSVTRRAACKKFGVGLAGMALARFGINQAQAITNGQLDGNAHPNVGGGGTLVATTSRGNYVNRALGVTYRIDKSEALSFLNDVIRRVNAEEL